MILCKEEYAKKINSAVFPGQQGGPLEHVIAGKAVAFKIAATEAFRERQQRTVDGAKAVAEALLQAGHGVNVLTGGTDVHLALVDLRESELDGQKAEDRLHDIGITVNRNAVPFDPRPPMVTSGLRVGTPRARHARPAGRRLRRGRRDHRHRADAGLRVRQATSWPSAWRRSPSATRSTSTWAPQQPSEQRARLPPMNFTGARRAVGGALRCRRSRRV